MNTETTSLKETFPHIDFYQHFPRARVGAMEEAWTRIHQNPERYRVVQGLPTRTAWLRFRNFGKSMVKKLEELGVAYSPVEDPTLSGRAKKALLRLGLHEPYDKTQVIELLDKGAFQTTYNCGVRTIRAIRAWATEESLPPDPTWKYDPWTGAKL